MDFARAIASEADDDREIRIEFVILLVTILHSTCEAAICPEQFIKLGGACYHFSEEQTDWIGAYNQCYGMGTSLVSFETKEEERLIHSYLTAQQKNVSYWTSGSDISNAGMWR